MADDIDFAALLCSRICHDLISPVGAVGNGLELLDPPRPEEADVRDLLSDSARTALAALGYFRVAFGVASLGGARTGLAEIGGIARAYYAGGRHKLHWPDEGDDLTRGDAKLLLLMAMAAVTAAPLGGALRVAPPQEFPLVLSVTAEGRRAGLGPQAAALLTGADAAAAATARDAHLALLARHAALVGATLTLHPAEESLTLRAARG